MTLLPNSQIAMSAAILMSFAGISLALLLPWLSQNQPEPHPIANIYEAILPFFGLLIGHSLALQTDIHLHLLLIPTPIILAVIQYRRLISLKKPQIKKTTSHHLYWLNISWFWISVVGYLLTNTLSNPIFFSVCFLAGFSLAISFINKQDPKTLQNNASAYWLFIQGCLFLTHNPVSFKANVINGLLVALYGAASCKLLIPNVSRLHQGQQTHFTLLNIALLFFAYAIYPFALAHRSLTSILLITLLIINAFITNTQSNFLSSTYALIQFILHRIGVRYTGTEHINYHAKQRVVLVSNHSCFLDVPIIATHFDEILTYPIYPFWLDCWAVRVLCGQFAHLHAMKPGQSSSLANVIHAIRNGNKCLIFPEGRLTDTGNLMKIFEGTVIIAEHAKADIQPVIINGGMNLTCSRDDNRHVKSLFSPIKVTFGPCTPLPNTDLRGKAKRKFIKREIFRRLTDTYMHSYPNATLCEALEDATRRFGKHRIALRDNDFLNDMSYLDLMQKAKLFATRLKRFVRPRQILAISVNHGADTAALYFACFMLEIIALPVDHEISSFAFKTLCMSVSIDAIVIDSSAWTELSHPLLYDCLHNSNTQLIEFDSINRPARYTEKLAISLQAIKHSQTHPESIPALLSFNPENATTTLLSQRNLCQQAYQLHICCDLQGSDTVFNALPLNHTYSLLMGLLHPLFSGVHLILTTASFSSKFIIESFYDTQSSILLVNDTVLNSIVPTQDDSFETLRMRAVFTNSIPDENVRKQWESHTKSYIFTVWEDPDNAGIIAINTPYYHLSNSIGQFLPLTKPTYNENQEIIAVSGPICPDFFYEKSPIAYRKQTNSSYPVPFSVSTDDLGFLFPSA